MKPRVRPSFAAARLADPGTHRCLVWVSNVTRGTGAARLTAASQSRSPLALPLTAPRATASWRVVSRDIENAWVGPPATTRVASAGTVSSALSTSVIDTSDHSASPSAVARAMSRVLPNIDS